MVQYTIDYHIRIVVETEQVILETNEEVETRISEYADYSIYNDLDIALFNVQPDECTVIKYDIEREGMEKVSDVPTKVHFSIAPDSKKVFDALFGNTDEVL